MGRAKSHFSTDAEIVEEINLMFAIVRGPALSNGMQATANIKPQSVLGYQEKFAKKAGIGAAGEKYVFSFTCLYFTEGTQTNR